MVKFAIIGLGHIGARHASHIIQNAATELVACCDINEAVAEKAAQLNIPFYNNVEEMLEQCDADVISICSPNHLHAPHAIAAANKGFHVLVEKPMALSTADCEAMIAASKQAEKQLFVVKQNRYNPPVHAVKELLDAKEMGKVLMIQVNCFWNRNEQYYQQSPWRGTKDMDGGCLFTQFSHFVDILYFLNGPIDSVKSKLNNFLHQHNTEFEDSGVIIMQAENGALINFNFTTCAYEQNMEGSITVFAEKGTLKIGGQYLNTLEYQKLCVPQLPQIAIQSKENDYGFYKGSMSNHDKIIQNVVDVLLYQQPIKTSGEEGKAVVEIIEKMYAGQC